MDVFVAQLGKKVRLISSESNERKNKLSNILSNKYRIQRYSFGHMNQIDEIVLSCKDGLTLSRLNKYFNSLISGHVFAYFIFENVLSSLTLISQMIIKHEIERNSKKKRAIITVAMFLLVNVL